MYGMLLGQERHGYVWPCMAARMAALQFLAWKSGQLLIPVESGGYTQCLAWKEGKSVVKFGPAHSFVAADCTAMLSVQVTL